VCTIARARKISDRQLAGGLRYPAVREWECRSHDVHYRIFKGQCRTTDFRSSAEIAVTLARKLVADGCAVSITAPGGDVYSADRFDRLLTSESLNSQE
jgi:hypothetical protein